MTFLPIVERELRVRARQAATHWGHAGLAFVVGQLAAQSFLYSPGMPLNQMGQGVFLSLAWVAQIVALACVILTADCLSAERRGGTLGLLFLTDLKGYDVVLGKLASAGLGAFYALLGLLPAFAIPLLAGGVTGGEVARYGLAVLNTLFVSLALGLWVSARQQEQVVALRKAAKWLLLLWLGPVLTQAIVAIAASQQPKFALLSPQGAFNLAADTAYRGQPSSYWLSLLIVQVEGWLFIRAASRSVMLAWREGGTVGAAIPAGVGSHFSRPDLSLIWPSEFLGLPIRPAVEDPVRYREARLHLIQERQPMRWLADQLPGQRALLWVAALLMVAPWTQHMAIGFGAMGGWLFAIMNVAHTAFYFGSSALLAWVASRGFLELRQSGAFELLLTTPEGARGLAPAYWQHLRRRLYGPVALMVLLQAPLVLPYLFMQHLGGLPYSLAMLLRPLNAALEPFTVCAVAMWLGLVAPKPAAAMLWAVGLVVGLPWLIFQVLWLGTGALRGGFAANNEFYAFYMFLVPVLTLAKTVFFLVWARRKLKGELRNAGSWSLPTEEELAGRMWQGLRKFFSPA